MCKGGDLVFLVSLAVGLASLGQAQKPPAASTSNVAVLNAEATTASPELLVADDKSAAGNAQTDARAGKSEPVGQTQAPPAMPPIPADLIEAGMLAAKYDSIDYQNWEMPFISAGDTVFGETFGLREALAKHKIGFTFYAQGQFSYNLREAPMAGYNPNPGHWVEQIYNGQRPTGYGGIMLFATYNISKHVQLGFSAQDFNPTWSSLSPGSTRMNGLLLHAVLLNDKLVVDLGWQGNDTIYYESYIAGNLAAGTLGMNAVIPYVVGQSGEDFAAPAVNLKYKITKHLYERIGAQRSLDPGGFIKNDVMDGAGLRFAWKGTRVLGIDEIGYRRNAAPGVKSIFVRGDGWFNTTHYTDYRLANFLAGKKSDNNFAVSLAADVQAVQTSKYLPFQGIYVGGTVQYAPPQQNLYTAYYEARAYKIGTFKRRPTDMAVLDANHLDFSQTALGTIAILPTSTNPQYGVPSFGNQTNVGLSYGYHIRAGLWITPAIEYTRHPTFAPKLTSPVWAQVSTAIYF